MVVFQYGFENNNILIQLVLHFKPNILYTARCEIIKIVVNKMKYNILYTTVVRGK